MLESVEVRTQGGWMWVGMLPLCCAATCPKIKSDPSGSNVGSSQTMTNHLFKHQRRKKWTDKWKEFWLHLVLGKKKLIFSGEIFFFGLNFTKAWPQIESLLSTTVNLKMASVVIFYFTFCSFRNLIRSLRNSFVKKDQVGTFNKIEKEIEVINCPIEKLPKSLI